MDDLYFGDRVLVRNSSHPAYVLGFVTLGTLELAYPIGTTMIPAPGEFIVRQQQLSDVKFAPGCPDPQVIADLAELRVLRSAGW